METDRRHLSRAYLTTTEVADYLRLKERKVYDLVRQGEIPCVRITGKLLFPKQSVDLWLMNHLEGDQARAHATPAVLAGSQDPLLEWAVRESGSDLAMLCHGSGDGVRRLLDGEAMLVGVHVIDPDTGRYNEPRSLGLGGMRDLVMVRWVARRQGLMVMKGNPHAIRSVRDLIRSGVRVAHRQAGAGAERLLALLVASAGLAPDDLKLTGRPALSEDDLALAIRHGEADVGLGVEAAALRQGLDFLPLHEECFDLAMRRRSFFEPPVQRLLAFTREVRFTERAMTLGGYTLDELGRVTHNA